MQIMIQSLLFTADDAGIRDRGGIRYTRQSAIEAMRRLNVEDFIVSSDQEALLNSIPGL